jgi:2-succinyl-5-enolpyruvyl-6-hydroxy-3-cyclohexene-1-carboxylate synthase
MSATALAPLNTLWAQALIDECVQAGARHAVVCPGSRSTPLALACLEDRRLQTQVVIDERSAAFLALGIGLQSGAPAILVCTSGTAGAHFYPAVIEASVARVPLVVLTADRPWELHGFGAPQPIDQAGLYGRHVREAVQLGLPEASADLFRHLRASVARAAAAACRMPRGPVHLNCPFREPLAPTSDPAHQLDASLAEGKSSQPSLHVAASPSPPNPDAIERIRRQLQGTRRALIVCGPRVREDGFGAAVCALGAGYGMPVLAEAASQARFGCGTEVIAHYDAILCDPATATSLRPEWVLRFGGGLTSKRLQQWLDASGAEQVLVSDEGDVFDPGHHAAEGIVGSAIELCHTLSAGVLPTSNGYGAAWRAAEARARGALAIAFAKDARLTEPRIAREVVSALPTGSQLFVSSSMPIRDVDAFAHTPERVRVFSNRGVNGIDGVVSSALGVAAASGRPTVALVGDLAFLHDLGALVTAHRAGIPLTVVAVNNDGGGIFSFLPIAEHPAPFERLFGTPHGLSFQAVAEWVGARYLRPDSPQALFTGVRDSLGHGLTVIEVKASTDRTANVEEHRALQRRVAAALSGEVRP